MLRNKRVLIIDDSDTIRVYLQKVLAQKEAEVDGAATAQEGLAMCARQLYDLILLDLFLPDADGIEVLQKIRPTNDTSTIVMITGFGGIKSAITAVQMGADGYIEKQNISSTQKDHVEFLYTLDQAMEHRAGLVAQQQLELIRADFYAMVTHDLRNPTSLILMATDMLRNENPSPSQQQELFLMIEGAATRLIGLINDYLDFAKIDAGYLHLDFGEVDLIQALESSARFARLHTQAKQQELILDMPSQPVLAHVDAERLRQVIDNLLSNAIKYTPEGGQITLSLAVEEDQAVFTVSDTGRGILPEYLPQLFTKYHRVPGDTSRGILGTGLGLLIVKEIAEAHGGSVCAESEGIPGKGSSFTVQIPLYPGEQPEQADHLLEEPVQVTEEARVDSTQDAELRRFFEEEVQRHLQVLQDAVAGLRLIPDDARLLDQARRASHTLKGNAGAMRMNRLYELATQLDNQLQQAAKRSSALTQTYLDDLAQLIDRIAATAMSE